MVHTFQFLHHGSDKKKHKDRVRKVAFTLQFLGDRTNFLHGTTVFGTAVCCYRTCVILVKMATRDAELSVLVRSLSKRKSTGSMLTLKELNKRTSLQERVYRKRKLKSMVIFLIFLLSHCTVERSVWQRQRSNAWFELAYETISLGHLAFSKLNCIVSSEKISINASTSSSSTRKRRNRPSCWNQHVLQRFCPQSRKNRMHVDHLLSEKKKTKSFACLTLSSCKLFFESLKRQQKMNSWVKGIRAKVFR